MPDHRLRIDLEHAPDDLRAGLRSLITERPHLAIEDRGQRARRTVRFHCDPDFESDRRYVIRRVGEDWEIVWGRRIDAFRALGQLLAATGDETELREQCHFEMFALQLECSRNGVPKPETVKAFLRRAALMGISVLLLYMEDTYEVPDEPFFGYLRGGYSQSELKEIDAYADRFGIEVAPSIQTLGHLKQMLQWKAAYSDVADTADVLLVGEKKTYELLGRMIDAATAPFRSKRIHLGMDEAFGLGTGAYRKRFGDRRTFDIMNEHLARVAGLCNQRGLAPMIWSDMYFRMASREGAYYDPDIRIPADAVATIPAEVDLVYWDYYHTDQSFYETCIDRHREMGKEPIVAPGCWNWSRFWTNVPHTLARALPCVEACKAKGVTRLLLTTWGDDGMECDLYSVLPVVQAIADSAYGDGFDEEKTARNFAASCLADYRDYVSASRLDQTPPEKSMEMDYTNTAKWLLWDDPLLGLCEPFHEVESYRPAYQALAEQLDAAAAKPLPEAGRLRFPAQLARTLALKCDCRKNLVRAYRSDDRKELKRLLETEVRPLLDELEKLWRLHRDMWLATYKPFGLEVIELRYGARMTRVRSLIDRLEDFLDGKVECIPEFDTKLLRWAKDQMGIGHFQRIATPSAIL